MGTKLSKTVLEELYRQRLVAVRKRQNESIEDAKAALNPAVAEMEGLIKAEDSALDELKLKQSKLNAEVEMAVKKVRDGFRVRLDELDKKSEKARAAFKLAEAKYASKFPGLKVDYRPGRLWNGPSGEVGYWRVCSASSSDDTASKDMLELQLKLELSDKVDLQAIIKAWLAA